MISGFLRPVGTFIYGFESVEAQDVEAQDRGEEAQGVEAQGAEAQAQVMIFFFQQARPQSAIIRAVRIKFLVSLRSSRSHVMSYMPGSA